MLGALSPRTLAVKSARSGRRGAAGVVEWLESMQSAYEKCAEKLRKLLALSNLLTSRHPGTILNLEIESTHGGVLPLGVVRPR